MPPATGPASLAVKKMAATIRAPVRRCGTLQMSMTVEDMALGVGSSKAVETTVASLIHTGKGGEERVQPERRLEWQQFTKLGQKYQRD